MGGSRRFSQAISEGRGISLIARVADAAAAQAAQADGADAVLAEGDLESLHLGAGVPLVWRGSGQPSRGRAAGADACVLVLEQLEDEEGQLERLSTEAATAGLECVVEVRDDEQLELALQRLDPEIVLLAAPSAEEDDPLDAVLDLLPDVPAGKLAIAEVPRLTREDVLSLERAGMDAVVVEAGQVAALLGGEQPAS